MNAAYVILAAPLLGAIVLLFGGRRIGDPLAGIVATVLSFGAFIATLVVWISLLGHSVGAHGTGRSIDKTIFTWIPVDNLHVSFGLQVDQLSILMSLFVTGVGSLIHLYSIGYMRGDASYPRFFFLLNLFLFSMVTLVLADNYLFSFLGWEGVGFCSYGLVGFWFERETAAVAAKKAFVTNRVGDFGFMIALFLMFGHFHSFSYSVVLAPLIAGHATLATVTATGLGLMLFLGAVGKSAQLPLYMWLPDAMEGPTPVSALIHAATMVTAGVYLVARSAPILHFSHASQLTIAVVGAVTALFAATIACAQNDIKRVLAYSTISQLGYMFLAEGSGNYTAGLYHMVTHAFFKALLFLAAGSVIHAMHDEQNMKRMGNLRKYLPITFPAFIVGYLALSGIPPFDGFWSKDDVLDAAWHFNKALWVIGAFTAGLTAYYMSRQVALVFFGRARWGEAIPTSEEAPAGGGSAHVEGAGSSLHGEADPGAGAGAPGTHGADGRSSGGQTAGAHALEGHGTGDPHESPPVMTIPLVLLAVLATLGWLFNAPFAHLEFIEHWLSPLFPTTVTPVINVSTATKWLIGAVTTVWCFVGLFAGLRAWRVVERPALEPAVLRHGWYVDETVAATVSGPVTAGADVLAFGVDEVLVDGTVNGIAQLTAASGRQLRRLQTGYVRNYALGIGLGATAILVYAAVRVGS
jgi:NADH-quinone oxidoreductase subunit L